MNGIKFRDCRAYRLVLSGKSFESGAIVSIFTFAEVSPGRRLSALHSRYYYYFGNCLEREPRVRHVERFAQTETALTFSLPSFLLYVAQSRLDAVVARINLAERVTQRFFCAGACR
jgi:hypothetical protein